MIGTPTPDHSTDPPPSTPHPVGHPHPPDASLITSEEHHVEAAPEEDEERSAR